MDCRLIIDEPADGAWNMAVDEALLQSAGRAGQGSATLRFYQWNQPTLSLGYFQKRRDRCLHESSLGCPLVRRSTGGGAILHDLELTYSYTVPAESHVGVDLQDFYYAFHETLIEYLGAMGIPAALCQTPPKIRPSDEPFLCFQRRAEGDVLLHGSKICGSAQRRHRGALLQHGSVLLARSAEAPELAGIQDLSGEAISTQQLRDSWASLLGQRLNLNLHRSMLARDEDEAASSLFLPKFRGETWTGRR